MVVALLLLNAVFNVVVWPQFYRRISSDPRARDSSGKATAFLRVHLVLIVMALVIAALSVLGAILTLIGVW
ncbi:SCO4848 family membrane protein [Glaciihabitans tibetensis]|nr:hypothetical protein [Glaciihabitans tibetensis]